MGNAFNLGRLFGIQIRLHYTWFILFTWVTVFLVYPDWSQLLSWVIAITTSLLFFASVLAHELAHSLVGRVYGVPIVSITLFIFGGVARMTREATKAGAEFKMAAAGPACSLVIGGLFGLVWFLARGILEPLAAMASWLAVVNLALAVFNLIPGFPLDGGRVFRSLLWRATGSYGRSTRIATRVGQGVGYLFILAGIAMVFMLEDWLSGLWLAFIGWFLENAASASYRQVQWRESLEGFTVANVMTSDYPLAPSDIAVSELVQRYVFPGGRHFFVVADGGRLQGMLTLHNIKSVRRELWDTTLVRDIMTPVDKLKVAYPAEDAVSIVERMAGADVNQLPVVSEGKVVGVVDRDSLIRYLRIRSELGSKV
jgi:Zn-dependent protease